MVGKIDLRAVCWQLISKSASWQYSTLNLCVGKVDLWIFALARWISRSSFREVESPNLQADESDLQIHVGKVDLQISTLTKWISKSTLAYLISKSPCWWGWSPNPCWWGRSPNLHVCKVDLQIFMLARLIFKFACWHGWAPSSFVGQVNLRVHMVIGSMSKLTLL